MNKILATSLCVFVLWSCSQKDSYPLSAYTIDYDGVLDTIMPHFAGLHDSITGAQRFLPKNKAYMKVHKQERQYEWLHYTEKEGYAYFMISRLQPSIKRDKYSAICGRFQRDKNGAIDSASYEELFWTWKMKKDSLFVKSAKLFKTVVETGDISQYTPEKSAGYWVEFPSRYVYYDKPSQTWKAKASY